jgi:glyoxylase-like metal-dependent hydrolase (beta-lactamase superfamily II)
MQLSDDVALVGSGDARLTNRYDCNVYAVDAPEGTVLVDTGAGYSVAALLERAESAFGPVAGVLLTHAHADHSQGGPGCQERGVEVIAGEATASLLRSGSETELGVDVARREGVYPDDYRFTNYAPDRTAEPPATLTIAGRRFEAVPFAGHAADHVVYLTAGPDRTLCFVGDAVYPDGSISLLNVPGSSLADYRADVDRLTDRDIDALLPGHGLPLLRDGQAAIEAAAEALAGMSTPPSRT